jgi:ATP-dependent Lon protease
MTKMLNNFAAETTFDDQMRQESQIGALSQSQGTPDLMQQEVHYEIPENATGYPYERIFRPYIDNATEIILEDPYIRAQHQVQNLYRFCALAIRLGTVQKIILRTGLESDENLKESDSRLEALKSDLNRSGIDFSFERIASLHDREICFDNGWIVKIGRGLDIYQRPENWVSFEAVDFSLRRCRRTKVDVFRK